MKQATLCFLIRGGQGDKELLLAMKKKGFGQGRWNGVGGRFVVNKDKNIFNTVIRELKEEIGVEVKNIERVAILNFYHPYLPDIREKAWQVHAFFARSWEGEPKESEEMKPKWFKINEIPFNEMWLDRKFWLSRVLSGEKLKAKFFYKEDEIISSHNIKVVNKFD